VDLEQGHWGDNSRSLERGTIRMRTIFWEEETLRSVTVGDWGVTVGVIITVVLVVITVGVTLVCTVGEGVCNSDWSLVG